MTNISYGSMVIEWGRGCPLVHLLRGSDKTGSGLYNNRGRSRSNRSQRPALVVLSPVIPACPTPGLSHKVTSQGSQVKCVGFRSTERVEGFDIRAAVLSYQIILK